MLTALWVLAVLLFATAVGGTLAAGAWEVGGWVGLAVTWAVLTLGVVLVRRWP